MDLEAFREDPKTVAEVERKLLLISEAAMRLGEDAERLCLGLPWHNIRGIGNWLRHRFDRVDVEMVWNTVIDDLPPLKSGVFRALTSPPANPQRVGAGLKISPGAPESIPHPCREQQLFAPRIGCECEEDSRQ
jgi:uncharacterized protein with HEPN domain